MITINRKLHSETILNSVAFKLVSPLNILFSSGQWIYLDYHYPFGVDQRFPGQAICHFLELYIVGTVESYTGVSENLLPFSAAKMSKQIFTSTMYTYLQPACVSTACSQFPRPTHPEYKISLSDCSGASLPACGQTKPLPYDCY